MKTSNTIGLEEIKARLQEKDPMEIIRVKMENGFVKAIYENDIVQYHTPDLAKCTPRMAYESIRAVDGFILLFHKTGGVCCSPDFELYTDWAKSLVVGSDFVKLAYENGDACWYTADLKQKTYRGQSIYIKNGIVEVMSGGKNIKRCPFMFNPAT